MPEFTPDDLAAIAAFRELSPRLTAMFDRVAPPPQPQPPPQPHPPAEKIIRVTAGQNLQQVLDTLPPEFRVELEAGATFGPIRLPNLEGGGRVIYGHAVTIAAKGDGASALTTAPGAHDWTLEGIAFIGSGIERDVIRLGSAGAEQNTLDAVPQRIVLRHFAVIGAPSKQHRGIALNSGDTLIENFIIKNIRRKDEGDTQGIGGGNGPGPYVITQGSIEAAGENIIFGGLDPHIRDLVPSDITIDGVVSRKPLAWRDEGWQIKNHFELKNARRVRVRNLHVENLWTPSHGYAINLKSVNQGAADSGGESLGAPWCVVEDVEFENLTVDNVCGAVTMHPNPDQAAVFANNIRFKNALFKVNRAQMGGTGWVVLMQGVGNVSIERTTMLTDGPTTIFADGPSNLDFRLVRSVLVDNGLGIKGAGKAEGIDTLRQYFPFAALEQNLIATSSPNLYKFGTNNRLVEPPIEQYLDVNLQDITGVAGWRRVI